MTKRVKKNWFSCLSEDEQRLLTHKQKVELRKHDRKTQRENRNWNRLTVSGFGVGGKVKSSNGFTVDFLLSQNYGFLQPIECDILKLLVQKYKLTEIADILGLSYCRVRGLIVKIRDKCELCNS